MVGHSLIDGFLFRFHISFSCAEYRNKVGVRVSGMITSFELIFIMKKERDGSTCGACLSYGLSNLYFFARFDKILVHHQIGCKSLIGMIDEQLLRVGGFTGYSAAGGVDCITLFDVKIQGLEWFTRIGFPGCLLIVLYG